MNMKKFLLFAALLALAAIPIQAQSTTWEIDPAHANAQFVVRHLGISNVQGEFTKVSGTVQLDEKNLEKSSVAATIDVSSVDTRNATRDKDLLSENFFNVAKYPTMTFQSKRIDRAGEGKLKVTGDLTLHGVTREVAFDVDGPSNAIKDPWGNTRRGLSATTRINRKDFGITADAGLVGDEIAITLDIEMVKK
jgi:polyisoprenoid-binding protein YceI